MATYTFSPPTVREGPVGDQRIDMYRTLDRGITVYKLAGVYVQDRFVSQDTQALTTEFYQGGHIYKGLSQAQRDAMIATPGLGVTSANFTVE
jgi:hypothetical protein